MTTCSDFSVFSKKRDWRQELLTNVQPDFTIECMPCNTDEQMSSNLKNVCFQVHSFILKQYPSFGAALDMPLSEQRERKMFISDADAVVVDAFVDFLYNQQWRSEFQPHARALLQLANRFLIESLKEPCALALLPQLQSVVDDKERGDAARSLIEYVELAVNHRTPLLQVACELIVPLYVYTFSVQQLLHVISMRGDLYKIKQACEQQLIRRLSDENACEFFFFAVQNACTELMDRAYEHVQLHWSRLKLTKPADVERMRESAVVKELLAPPSKMMSAVEIDAGGISHRNGRKAMTTSLLCDASSDSLMPGSTGNGGLGHSIAATSSALATKSCDWFRRSLLNARSLTGSDGDSLTKNVISRFATLYPNVDLCVTSLPLKWNLLGLGLTVDETKSLPVITYDGSGLECSDSALARTDQPIPPACGVFYFEVTVVNEGANKIVGVGICDAGVMLDRMPGWDEHSVGYHGDDGMLFMARIFGTQYGPTFGSGDIIGCGVDFVENAVFFTKNGTLLRVVSITSTLSAGDSQHPFPVPLPYPTSIDGASFVTPFYPAVGCRSPGAILKCNCGQELFMFDIDHNYHQQAHKVVDPSPVSKSKQVAAWCLVDKAD